MEETFELKAERRVDAGKGASRRLRHAKKIPAILYGGKHDPIMLALTHSELDQHLQHEAFYSHILTVKYDGKAEKAILRDLQRHPSKPWVMHVDLQRVSEGETIRMNVPLHFVNEETAHGVKQEGGVLSHVLNEVEISCQARHLPEYIEVDVANLKLGESIHLSELKLPAGVEIVALSHGEEYDQPVANITAPRAAVEEAAAEEEEAAPEAAPEEGEAEAED